MIVYSNNSQTSEVKESKETKNTKEEEKFEPEIEIPEIMNDGSLKVDKLDKENKTDPKKESKKTIKKTEVKKPIKENNKKGNYTFEDNKIQSKPPKKEKEKEVEIKFTMPKTSHTDTFVDVKTTLKNASKINWEIKKDGKSITLSNAIDGNLTDKGGKVRFKEKGEYQVRAYIKDSKGNIIEYISKIMIYPVINTDFSLDKVSHIDKEVNIKTSNLDKELVINWFLYKEKENKDILKSTSNKLSNTGGYIKFREEGSYTVKLSVKDKSGRIFTESKNIKIYPILKIDFELPKTAFTDTKIDIKTINENNLPIKWSIKKDDKDISIQDAIAGNLTDKGGEIRFKSKGNYKVTALATDKTGEKFTKENDITIYQETSGGGGGSNSPKKPEVNVEVTNSVKEGKFLVNISIKRDKPEEEDKMTYEYVGKSEDDYYEPGSYILKARAIDEKGRMSAWSEIKFDVVNSLPSNPKVDIEVTREFKDGKFLVNINAESIDTDIGDEITYEYEGKAEDNYYELGDYVLRVRAIDSCGGTSDWVDIKFSVINKAPSIPKTKVDVTRTFKDGKFLVNLSSESTDPEGDEISYEYEGKAEDNYYRVGSHIVRVKAVDIYGGASAWTEIKFDVINNSPTIPVAEVEVTRKVKDGKFLVNIFAESTDPDGDKITYEYEGKAEDNYYKPGNYTVRVRANDNFGGISEWTELEFKVINLAPTTPIITRSPDGNNVEPDRPITIKASGSIDPEGDDITYIWENRPEETSVYPLGKNVVRVKAVDSAGAESPWTAIVFFVTDPNNGGGMTLTGRESSINEDGIEGATIASYTFTVPPVNGHSGNDYGKVKGYNIKTETWDQLDYKTTSNGITFEKELEKGVYSKLEFYYYTDHNCMYGKSNITYSVEYYFG